MQYAGHDLTGPSGTVHRIPDSLRQSFIDEFGPQMPDLTWVTSDEIAAGGGSHPDLADHDTLGLVTDAALSAHDGDTNAHVYFALDVDLTAHSTAGHPGLYSAAVHSHAQSSVTNLVTDLAGKAAASHSHTDSDLPAGLARDSEVAAAIDNHSTTATHGGGSLPAGVIVMWGGLLANIPSGWALCDGLNGTPDLRSRFIKGAADGANPGSTGGSLTHTHASHTGILSHTHAVSVTDPGHTHVEQQNTATTGGLTGWGARDTSTNNPAATSYSTASATTGITAATSSPAGAVSALAHDSPNSEPPYYALAFIQKL